MTAQPLPDRPNVEFYRKQAKQLLKACKTDDATAIERARRHHPHAAKVFPPWVQMKLADAQVVIARENGFDSWPKFVQHMKQAVEKPAVSPTLSIVDAARRGDVESARALLKADPALIHSKDEEGHGLLYVTASYGFCARSRTNQAFVDFLIEAGAEIDLHAAAFLARPDRVRDILRAEPALVNQAAPPYDSTALHYAAERGDLATVRALVEGGAGVAARDKFGRTPLAVAAHAGPWKPEAAGDVIDYLVEHGAKLDLFSAAALGNIELLERIAGRGSLCLTARDEGGCTALWHAARNNRIDAVRWLLAHGAQVNDANADGQTALSTAVLHYLPHQANPALIRYLLEQGSTPNAAAVEAESAFLNAAAEGQQGQAERVLSEHPALPSLSIHVAAMLGDVEAVEAHVKRDASLVTRRGGPKNWDPLLYLSFSRFHRNSPARGTEIVRAARLLLARGANPNTYFPWEQDEKNKLPVLWAATAESNHPALARVLLEAGANPDDGESIYHCAEKFHEECLELLHEFGVNVKGPFPPWNNTPLYFVLSYHRSSGHAATVEKGIRWLLEHGADPNVPSYENQERPVHLAANNGWGPELFEQLARHGADLRILTRRGRTAYEIALRDGNEAAARWLSDHGAGIDLDAKLDFLAACARGDRRAVRAIVAREPEIIRRLEGDDWYQIHSAANAGHVEAVRLMLDAGWAVDARWNDGATPLHCAAWRGQYDVVRLLLERGAPVNVEDPTYHSTPLGHAVHGSLHFARPGADYPAVVEALYAAGGERKGGLYGSDEVRAVLERHGVK